jgi:hypothetical protein
VSEEDPDGGSPAADTPGVLSASLTLLRLPTKFRSGIHNLTEGLL